MKNLIERLTTKHFRDYPYKWIGSEEYGICSNYFHHGFPFGSTPDMEEFVFNSSEDQSPAFKVVYVNKETRRLRVKKTDLKMEYNEIYKEHVQKNPGYGGFAPDGSRILLVRI